MLRLILAISLALACLGARGQDLTMRSVDSTLQARYATDPSRIYLRTNIGHSAHSVKTSCDGKYIFTKKSTEVNVLDAKSLLIIKTLEGRDYLPHPTDPDLLYLQLYDPSVPKGQPCNVWLLNWKTGEVLAHLREMPEYMWVNDDVYRYKNGAFCAYRQQDVFEGWGYQRTFSGALKVDDRDSLLIITSSYPLIYDLKRGVVAGVIDYKGWLEANDGRYRFDPENPSARPQPVNWSAKVGNTYQDMFGFEAYFTDRGTIEIGGFGPHITEWRPDGTFVRATTLSQRPGPVFSFHDVGNKRFVAASEGTLVGTNGSYRRADELSLATSKYYDGQQTNIITAPFGKPGKERLLAAFVSGSGPGMVLIDGRTGRMLDKLPMRAASVL